MEIFNYFVFVILPVFILGFQALLLPALFFLKSRDWLQSYAFALGGAIVGIGFGYAFGFDETFALVAGQNYELFVTVGDSFGTSGSWSFALVVPEPATGLLSLLGLVVLGARVRPPG